MTLKTVVKKGQSVLSLLSEEEKKKYIYCRIDQVIHELTYEFPEDGEKEIHFFDLTDTLAMKIYASSMCYLTAFAVRELNPRIDIRIFFNISRSLFVKVVNPKNFKMSNKFVRRIEEKMKELVEKDIPFTRMKASKNEAQQLYKKEKLNDKVEMLKYRKEDFVHFYEAHDGDIRFVDYMTGLLVPSSGYLNKFNVRFYHPGFVVQIPRAEHGGEIPPFHDEQKFATSLASASKWAEMNRLSTVSEINRFIKEFSGMGLINVSEARVNNMLAELGENIVKSSDPIRLICVAGPSSSGKTSFANRLMYELISRGLRPIRISIDNFYIPKDQLPKGTDIESIDALDVDYFNKFLLGLIQGETLKNPIYEFKTGKRKFGKQIHLEENQPIIIEGIHALNPLMTNEIPDYQKYKIYIAPQPQLNVDNHTPISMTDMRLIRRIARDARTRGSDAKETIGMWPNVRNGEFKYIYPTQEYADFVFDTFLPYEPCVLRDIVIPQLDKITPADPEYITAQRLKYLLKFFIPLEINDIPCNSLMREFVGGSSFLDAR